jgi:hypothetical protein
MELGTRSTKTLAKQNQEQKKMCKNQKWKNLTNCCTKSEEVHRKQMCGERRLRGYYVFGLAPQVSPLLGHLACTVRLVAHLALVRASVSER